MNPSHLAWLFSYSGRLHCTEYRVVIYVSLCSVAFNRLGRIWSNLCTVSIKRSRMSVNYTCQVSGSRGIFVIRWICLACNTAYLFKIHVEELGCHFCAFVDWLFVVAMCKERLALNNKTMLEWTFCNDMIHSYSFIHCTFTQQLLLVSMWRVWCLLWAYMEGKTIYIYFIWSK